ncbi:GreA/GreB family elongation factor [Limibaculum sp. M0105]|uniref:GreA/GreB family elongation factor n=1 Tax=Thermohalobaculum xanthum TaxID=2753746 RepID=A0A8J7M788_9RHOB|nr:GreA/GreB family elongation factor [Thermohalobaculum xanthum]MBK0399844.1 GreA/GreB family elongation factor [Thermohalobaculum xanthum]
MSRAFTKEDDGSAPEVLPDLPQSPHPNYVTPQGLAALQQRLAATRAELAALKARGDDLAVRSPIAVAERDLRFIEERLRRAIPVDPAAQPPGIVAFGAEVTVEDEAGASRVFRIVGEDEADPAEGLITAFSPLGRALIGLQVGDLAVWERPAGRIELEITAIRFV